VTKPRRLALLALALAAFSALVLWRRRSLRAPEPGVQLGLADGSARTLDLADPATAGLRTLAAAVRDSFSGGA
jgi:hypothetical protein